MASLREGLARANDRTLGRYRMREGSVGDVSGTMHMVAQLNRQTKYDSCAIRDFEPFYDRATGFTRKSNACASYCLK